MGAMGFVKGAGLALLGVAAALLGIGVVARFSDGPIGPFPGGALRAGPLVSEARIDWSFAEGVDRIVLAELQLVDPLGSRKTGILVHRGQLYAPCDLGFIWRRLPLYYRWLMHFVWSVKRWHEDALRDGRAVIRIHGTRYERQAVLETDPEVIAALSSHSERMAESFFGLRFETRPPDPETMWFFRLDPRPPE